ncbi:MAG: multiheme c-type cytochrome, partial [Myxococcota bacterium]
MGVGTVLAVAIALAAASPATAKPRKAAADPAIGAPPVKLEVDELGGKLFPRELPLDPGGAAVGVANPSAQACAACHPDIADQWARSAHAGPPSRALRDAAVGMPACLGCHLPLTSQHEQLYAYDGGRIDRAVAADNLAFDPTLTIEGVTCAACHVRDGAIAVSTDVAASHAAPHRMVWAKALGDSDGCAACHQLAWPGSPEPLYDTFGEWKRSGFAEAGITCLGCHARGGADGAVGADHAMVAEPARAVSVLLGASTLRLVRGGAPLPVSITLQNTGAGHAFPTGTPFRGVRMRV